MGSWGWKWPKKILKVTKQNSGHSPCLTKQWCSFPVPSPGSPRKAQPRRMRQFPSTFCRIFRHIVARRCLGRSPGNSGSTGGKWLDHFTTVDTEYLLFKWFRVTISQSVIGSVRLSKGSPHLGSESDLQTQHRMDNPGIQTVGQYLFKWSCSYRGWRVRRGWWNEWETNLK